MERVGKWLGHPREIYNLLRFKMGGGTAVMPPRDQVSRAGAPENSHGARAPGASLVVIR
uniref:Uncharacterized protein n=1 Tax=Gopherus agassizii TaxID=38772 RepID=A0A452GMG4_9SAUR